LQESLRIAHNTGALRTQDLRQVTVDTIVQSKAVTFPTMTLKMVRTAGVVGELLAGVGTAVDRDE
jgi:hypothetical protein